MHCIRVLIGGVVLAGFAQGMHAQAPVPAAAPAPASTQPAEPAAAAEPPAPTPPAAQPPGREGYPDIYSLAEPGSSAKLFPGPGPSPGPGRGAAGGAHHNGGLAGARQRNTGRSHDMLVEHAALDPLDVRIAYRRAKTIALIRDPALSDVLRSADTVRTEVEKRALLKQYYTRLFAEVCKVDPSPGVKAHVALLSKIASQHYDPQRRAVGGEEDLVNGRGGRRSRAQ